MPNALTNLTKPTINCEMSRTFYSAHLLKCCDRNSETKSGCLNKYKLMNKAKFQTNFPIHKMCKRPCNLRVCEAQICKKTCCQGDVSDNPCSGRHHMHHHTDIYHIVPCCKHLILVLKLSVLNPPQLKTFKFSCSDKPLLITF